MTAATCVRKPGSVWSSCRCADCLRVNARTKALHELGRLPARPSDAAWAVIEERTAAGWSPLAIASAAGIPARTLHNQIERYQNTGHRGDLHHATAHAILHLGTPTDGWVGSHGARRRLRALAAAGWAIQDLHPRLSRPSQVTLYELRAGRRDVVHAAAHNAIAALYDDLARTPGLSDRTRALAAREGWEPPASWDDDTIDDPLPVVDVDEVAVERAIAGRPVELTPAERDLAIPRMTAAGMSDAAIAAVLGVVPETVRRQRRRLGVSPVPREARAARAS